MIEQAVILAVGRGMRLGPLTKDRPRAMLPVLGKPIVARIMDWMRDAGIRRFIVVMGEQEGAVAAYLNSSWVPDAEVKFVLQTDPRGTAHALSLAIPHINGPFLVASTDNLTSVAHITQLLKRFDHYKDDMVLSVTAAGQEENGRGAVLTTDGTRVTAIGDQALTSRSLIAFALYACGKRLLNHLDDAPLTAYGEREIARSIQSLIKDDGKIAYVNAEWRLHLNRDLDLLTMNKRFLREGRDTHILSELPGSVHIIPPVRIDPKVSVGLNAKIGPNVYLESGSSIGGGAVIWDTVVLRDAAVQPNEVLHGQIIARRARLSEEVEIDRSSPDLF